MMNAKWPVISLLLCCMGLHTSHSQPCPDNKWPPPTEVWALNLLMEGVVMLPDNENFTASSWVNNYWFWGTPGAIVFPESIYDVRTAVNFAREHDIKVSIKSSGHDYIGRNTADDSLHIYLYNMNEISVNESDPSSPTGASAWIGTGTRMHNIYEEVDKYGLLAVGGSALTVSPGGYLLGGGHSALTPTLGLGVDSVLEIHVVLADGRLALVTNETVKIEYEDGSTEVIEDGDLFWALMGGGGSTFGVVGSYKIMLHPAPPKGFVGLNLQYPMIHSTAGNIAGELFNYTADIMLNDLASNGWGGYMVTGNYPGSEGTEGSVSFYLLHFGGWDTAAPVISKFEDFHPEWRTFFDTRNYSTFWEYAQGNSDGIGSYQYIVNKLLQEEDFTDSEKLTQIFTSAIDVFPIYLQCTSAFIGGSRGRAAAIPADQVSVSPDLRSSMTSTTCGVGYEQSDGDYTRSVVYNWARENLYPLGKGVYYNEPDYYIEDWKTEYWQTMDRYNELLRIKNVWDPNNFFTCHKCVGSDLPNGAEYTKPSKPLPFMSKYEKVGESE